MPVCEEEEVEVMAEGDDEQQSGEDLRWKVKEDLPVEEEGSVFKTLTNMWSILKQAFLCSSISNIFGHGLPL